MTVRRVIGYFTSSTNDKGYT